MRYQGSKKQMSSLINTIVKKNINDNDWYVEPFGGGMNSMAYIEHPLKIANDFNPYTIALWRAIKHRHFKPEWREFCKNLTQEQYNDMKQDCLSKGKKYPMALLGYVGFACSYGGGWWNGYAHYNEKKKEDHIKEAFNGLRKQLKSFKNFKETHFTCGSYDQMNIHSNSFIYCDPPYLNTKEYANSFDNNKFWNWCREQIKKGCKLLVSEYNAPEDFICVWEKERKNNMGTNNKGNRTEKLFVHLSQKDLIKI